MAERAQATTRTGSEEQQYEVEELEDDCRCWCGVTTYITGPASIRVNSTGAYQSNVKLTYDKGCRNASVDEVSWTITDVPAAYKDWVHIPNQSNDSCSVKIESGVPVGTQFTLHAMPKAHGVCKGTNARVPCATNKADAQVINVGE
jgi:hypothetical protein